MTSKSQYTGFAGADPTGAIAKQAASVFLLMRFLYASPLKKTHLERIKNALISIIPSCTSLPFQPQYSFIPHFIQSNSRLLPRESAQFSDFFIRYKFGRLQIFLYQAFGFYIPNHNILGVFYI